MAWIFIPAYCALLFHDRFGMYRSRQHYIGSDGQVIGCVDMLVPYEK